MKSIRNIFRTTYCILLTLALFSIVCSFVRNIGAESIIFKNAFSAILFFTAGLFGSGIIVHRLLELLNQLRQME